MKQNKTITKLFDCCVNGAGSDTEWNNLIQHFDTAKNERLLKQLIRKQLESDDAGEIPGDLTAVLSDSYKLIKNRIRR